MSHLPLHFVVFAQLLFGYYAINLHYSNHKQNKIMASVSTYLNFFSENPTTRKESKRLFNAPMTER
jgi:hypothetical protein